jgi:hypothetical protein
MFAYGENNAKVSCLQSKYGIKRLFAIKFSYVGTDPLRRRMQLLQWSRKFRDRSG